jgi:hypothetical protein
MLSSSILSADHFAEQIVEQFAELKSKPEGKRSIRLVSQSELDALPMDTPVAWSTKPTSPEGPSICN